MFLELHLNSIPLIKGCPSAACQNLVPYAIGAKIITRTTFIVGEPLSQLHTHTHQLHNCTCRGIHLCNACVSLVSVCLASILSRKGSYTTIMLGELIFNYTHTSYTTIPGSLSGLHFTIFMFRDFLRIFASWISTKQLWPIILRNFLGISHRSFGPNSKINLVIIASNNCQGVI